MPFVKRTEALKALACPSATRHPLSPSLENQIRVLPGPVLWFSMWNPRFVRNRSGSSPLSILSLKPCVKLRYGPRHESAAIIVVRLPPGSVARDTASSTVPLGWNTADGFVAECQSSESVRGPCTTHSLRGASGRDAEATMIGPAVSCGAGGSAALAGSATAVEFAHTVLSLFEAPIKYRSHVPSGARRGLTLCANF